MFEGIITPIVTPFHRDAQESINYEATKQLIDHLIEHGVKGIFHPRQQWRISCH